MSATTGQLEDLRWLVSPAAAPWLDEAARVQSLQPALLTRWRQTLSAERVHLICEQAELRRRAVAKFSAAGSLFFTRRGLEQASDQWCAWYKSQRFARGERVADLCCGIGGELMALAQRGPVQGFDRDPVIALLAEANVRAVLPVHATQPLRAIAAEVAVATAVIDAAFTGEFAAWHADPDRRPTGKRTSNPLLYEPPVEVWDAIRARLPHGAIKLAPAAELPAHWSRDAELEWLSWDRECRQQVAWFGNLARQPGRKRATVLSPPRDQDRDLDRELDRASNSGDGHALAGVRTVEQSPGLKPGDVAVAGKPQRFVLEPDPAVIAAGLVDDLAAEHGHARLLAGLAYLTGEQVRADEALRAFEVLDVLPLDVKKLRAWLRERSIGRLEIKQRGAGLDPATLAKQLGRHGEESATLILARNKKASLAVMCRRVAATD